MCRETGGKGLGTIPRKIFLRSLNLSHETERPQDFSLPEADGISDRWPVRASGALGTAG